MSSRLSERQRTWLYGIALVGVAEPVIAFDVYALFVNHTAHTALPTRWLAAGLLCVALVAAVALWVERRGQARAIRALIIAIMVVGLTGVANVLAFEHLNVMMDYEIWVHDYDSSVVGGENLATLRVYVGGLLVWEGSQSFEGEDARELLATVKWPEGVVSAP